MKTIITMEVSEHQEENSTLHIMPPNSEAKTITMMCLLLITNKTAHEHTD